MTAPKFKTLTRSFGRRKGHIFLFLLPAIVLVNLSSCPNINVPSSISISADNRIAPTVYLNRDLSAGNLSQWTHRDFGMGTDVGSNESGAGYVWYHPNVSGRAAVGLTVSSTSHASPAPSSDSVYLWEPANFWNHQGSEIWLRTSVRFPSPALLQKSGLVGESTFRPVTGDWNWFLEFHDDSSPKPDCSKELANIALDVKTDDVVRTGIVGISNARLAMRIMGRDGCAPNIVWVDGPKLTLDHWYELLLHIKWDSGNGIVEWYVDDFNRPIYSNLGVPNLYARPAGYLSPSFTSLTVANYRWHAGWNSTIYFGPLAVGPTRSSVLSAF